VAWAYDGISHDIVPIGLPSGRIGTPIELADPVVNLAVSGDGILGYALLASGSAPDAKWTLAIVNLSTGRLRDSLPLPQIGGGATIAVGPDELTVYVGGDHDLYPVYLTQRRVGRPIPVPCGPCGWIAISSDGNTAYVVSGSQDKITPVNLSTKTAEASISLPQIRLGSIVISPDGKTAFISSPGQGVYATPLGSPENSALVPVSGATFVVLDPWDRTPYAVDSFPGALTPIDPTTLSLGSPIDVGIQIERVAISASGTAIAVGGASNPSRNAAYVIVDLATGRMQRFTPPRGTFLGVILGVAVGPSH